MGIPHFMHETDSDGSSGMMCTKGDVSSDKVL